ncbi:MAG TPA: AtpZ/AtpI family protein [Patescibacteria group bacterium]|nr:AtpZ/AtpI family protein [Patescibacteria group bacterium]
MDLKKIVDFRSIRELSLSVFYYISGSIIGPLLIFCGLGYLLDSYFGTTPTFIVVGVFVAFVTTNFLLFKKVVKINSLVNKYVPPKNENKTAQDEKKELNSFESQKEE